MSSIRYLHTTINPGNDASWAVFESLAQRLETSTERTLLFSRKGHFQDQHDDEVLLSVGPFNPLHLSPEVSSDHGEELS